MISLNSQAFGLLNQAHLTDSEIQNSTVDFSVHQQWNHQRGWKNVLNNLRLIIQPTILLGLISPWLDIFPNHYLLLRLLVPYRCYVWRYVLPGAFLSETGAVALSGVAVSPSAFLDNSFGSPAI